MYADRGRPVISGGTLLTDNGLPLRGESLFLGQWADGSTFNEAWWRELRDDYHLNAMRLLMFRPPQQNNPNCGPSTGCEDLDQIVGGQTVLERMDEVVDIAGALGMYIIVDYHPVGGHDAGDAMAWWSQVAPRYQNRTHVIYEACNEPVAWSPQVYGPADVQFVEDSFSLIRGLAPDTPIILWSFANATTAMRSKVEEGTAINYSNALVGYHPYGSYSQSGVANTMSAFPVMNTEVGGSESNFNSQAFIDQVADCEALGVSWILLAGTISPLGPFYPGWQYGFTESEVYWAPDPLAVDQSTGPGPDPDPDPDPAPDDIPTTPTDPDLMLYWPFDEDSGSVIYDYSGYQKHGVRIGGAWSTGIRDGALSLNSGAFGLKSHPELGAQFPTTTSTQNFTVASWVKLDSLNARQPIISRQGDQQRGFLFMVEDNNRPTLQVWRNGSNSTDISAADPLTANTWYHLAATYEYIGANNSRVRLYVDGELVASSDAVVGPVASNSTDFEVGRYYWSNAYSVAMDGALDDLYVYRKVLSQSEIEDLRFGQRTILHWGFDFTLGSLVPDLSDFANDGTRVGAKLTSGLGSPAFKFNGQDSYVYRESNQLGGGLDGPQGLSSFTISAVIRTSSVGERNPIVSKQANQQRGFLFAVGEDNRLAFQLWNPNNELSEVRTPDILFPFFWYHVAVTYEYLGDGDSICRLYVNGLEVDSNESAVGPINPNDSNFEVGRYNWSPTYIRHYSGIIDEVKVINRALSPAQIVELATPN